MTYGYKLFVSILRQRKAHQRKRRFKMDARPQKAHFTLRDATPVYSVVVDDTQLRFAIEQQLASDSNRITGLYAPDRNLGQEIVDVHINGGRKYGVLVLADTIFDGMDRVRRATLFCFDDRFRVSYRHVSAGNVVVLDIKSAADRKLVPRQTVYTVKHDEC